MSRLRVVHVVIILVAVIAVFAFSLSWGPRIVRKTIHSAWVTNLIDTQSDESLPTGEF